MLKDQNEAQATAVQADASSLERLAAWIGLMGQHGVGAMRLWEIVASSDPEREWRRRSSAADRVAAAAAAAAHLRRGVTWTEHGDPRHPSVEVGDPHVPAVLFWRGSAHPPVQHPPSVGIVGTRRASRLGNEVAAEIGEACAGAGVRVVSGLAAGIDAAAHRGALNGYDYAVAARSGLAAPPLAVVGTGLDVVYPARNAQLWSDVAAAGTICSEYPLGTEAAPWRFPARNRILVAQCDLVVVVESSERGGSLITAGIAAERGVPVMAVPGSVRSANAVGTNRLLADGCAPCLGPDDVLLALGLTGRLPLGTDDSAGGGRSESQHGESLLTDVEREILDAIGWDRASTESVAVACASRSLGELLLGVQGLVRSGHISDRGGWLERVR